MRRSISIFLLFLLFQSCASFPTKTEEECNKESLTKRIELFWNAKLKDDFQTMASLMDPDIPIEEKYGSLNRFNKFATMSKITEYKIDKIDMLEKDKAKVFMKIRIAFLIVKSSDNNFEEVVSDNWIKKDRTWYVHMIKPTPEDIFQQFIKK